MQLSAIDAISAFFLILVYLKRTKIDRHFQSQKEMNDQLEAARALKRSMLEADEWTIELENALHKLEINSAALAFLPFLSKNSLGLGIGFGAITLALGLTSIPGTLFGLIAASPRFYLYAIRSVQIGLGLFGRIPSFVKVALIFLCLYIFAGLAQGFLNERKRMNIEVPAASIPPEGIETTLRLKDGQYVKAKKIPDPSRPGGFRYERL